MADDFAPNASTTGRYSIYGTPLEVRVDPDGMDSRGVDSDWIRVSGFEKYTNYSLLRYRIDGKRSPDYVSSNIAIYDIESRKIGRTGSTLIPGETTYYHQGGSGDFFVETEARRGDLVEAYYNFYSRPVDYGADNFASAFGFWLHDEKGVGGRIDSTTDEDWFQFPLVGGKTYTIDLFGGSTPEKETTLGNPILRMLGHDGRLIASDNNSGIGKNAKLVFTPAVDETVRFQVIGNGTIGTYFLHSDQFDDFVSTTKNAALRTIGDSASGRIDFNNDLDFLKFEVTKGSDYRFNISGVNENLAFLVDEDGKGLSDLAGVYNAQKSGFVYAHIGGFFGENWNLETEEVFDAVGETNDDSHRITTPRSSAIDFAGDRDRFNFSAWSYGLYTIDVVGEGGQPLANPAIAIRKADGEFVTYQADGSHFYLTDFSDIEDFESSPIGTTYVDVISPDGSTGQYNFRLSTIDRTPGDTSTAWTVGFKDGKGIVRDLLERVDDVDFYRVNLKANTWYEFGTSFGGNQRFSLQSPDGSVTPFEFGFFGGESSFFSAVAGDYYIVTKGEENGIGSIQFDLTEGMRPTGPTGEFAWSSARTNEGLNYNQSLTSEVADSYRVVSDVEVTYLVNGTDARVSLPAGELRLLSGPEWESILSPPGDGYGELYSQGVPDGAGPAQYHSWGNVLMYREPDPEEIEDIGIGSFWSSYEFAQELPERFIGDGRFSNFAPVTASEEDVFADAALDWTNKARTVRLVPTDGFRAADVSIFKAALNVDIPLMALPRGSSFGDIIINTNSSVMADLTPGGQGYFELLRAVGKIGRLRETTEYELYQSVMGDRDSLEMGELYPSTIMPFDSLATRSSSDYLFNVSGVLEPFELSGPPFVKMITALEDDGGSKTISAAGSSYDSRIDLRRGAHSYSTVGDETPFRFINSFHSSLEDGRGGEGDDILIGNQGDNILSGNGGNDVLRGGAGNDLLQGGQGDDFYQFRPGYGDDVIDEVTGGGGDILRIEGPPMSGGLFQNLTFEKLGLDMIVRLELPSGSDQFGDSVTINNMGIDGSRIETLTILDGAGKATAWIDLASVYNQLADKEQRFGITLDKTQFGHLTVPIG